jgi:general L-amino acid transport system permease protein
VTAKFAQFMYGRYPEPERWRVDLVYILALAGLVPLMIPRVPGKFWNAVYVFAIFPVLAFFLLVGGVLGLPHVGTELWGGLLVTLVVASVGIAGSLPIGVLLALGRRSKMPVVRWVSIGFIEFVRGVPLITVLFMASVMLPLFLPPGMTFDKLLRALIGVALFSAAYMAEVIRGGLQAIPRGQFEAAEALGLSYPQRMGLIVLPQALKLVIPGIVNTFIGLFKDTSLVLIIGLFDLLGIVQLNNADSKWFSPTTAMTGYVFAGFIFWLFCFFMSRYSQMIERRLATGHERGPGKA